MAINLDELRSRRDTAIKNDERWILSAEELLEAYKLGEREFSRATLDGANLSRANLSRATLDGATLDGANLDGARSLINTRGIYSAYAPGMSSRNDYLLAGIDEQYALVFYAGCFTGSAEALRSKIVLNHGDNGHARRYLAAIAFIETCYQADIEDGVWERMKERAAAHEAETGKVQS